MKKPILIPFLASSVLMGCNEQTAQQQTEQVLEQRMQQAQWVGQYQGTTPCMGCLSRCEDCPGMAVSLDLKADHQYELHRESLSGHNEVEVLTGQFAIGTEPQPKIQLLQLPQRNLLHFDPQQQQVQIREDQSGKVYLAQQDFTLHKTTLLE